VQSIAAEIGRVDDERVAADTTSSLVIYGAYRGAEKCPNRGAVVLDLVTGKRFPAGCKVYGCPTCGPRKAWAVGQLGAASRPERLVTLTQAPRDWSRCRDAMNNLSHALRRRGYRTLFFWAIEPNPRRTGYHIHALQHGAYVPQALLQKLWGAIAHVEAVKTETEQQGRVAFYVVKGAAASHYVTKGTVDDLTRHLAMNGQRTAHWSRGYMRLDNDEPATARALRLAMRKGSTDGRYVLVGAGETDDEIIHRRAFAEHMREQFTASREAI
jgi:hypothetical protein